MRDAAVLEHDRPVHLIENQSRPVAIRRPTPRLIRKVGADIAGPVDPLDQHTRVDTSFHIIRPADPGLHGAVPVSSPQVILAQQEMENAFTTEPREPSACASGPGCGVASPLLRALLRP
jgi:hypothetical protein